MKKFDILNVENGTIATVKDGTKYVFINGCFYNFKNGSPNLFDFIFIDRDGKCAKFPSGAKDVVSVSVMSCCPAANRLSEAMKSASGIGSKYVSYITWIGEDPAVTAAKANLKRIEIELVQARSAVDIAISRAR